MFSVYYKSIVFSICFVYNNRKKVRFEGGIMHHQEINSNSGHFSGTYFENTDFDFHFHNSYELIYVTEGALIIEIGGLSITVNKDEFFLISPCAAHSLKAVDKYKCFINIFPKDYINVFFSENMEKLYFHFTPDADTLEMYLQEMYNKRSKQIKKYLAISCLYSICQSALMGKPPLQSMTKDSNFVFNVNKIISEKFKTDIKRKDIADMLHYDEHYFSNMFSKNFNMNFREYLNIIRISYAKNLLWHSNMNITEIALESGFKSIRNFNSVFKAQTGMIPTKYKKEKTHETIFAAYE